VNRTKRRKAAKVIPLRPTETGRSWQQTERDALASTEHVGRHGPLADVIVAAIAPNIIDGDLDLACDPPEATALRLLAFDLRNLSAAIEQGNYDEIELSNNIEAMSKRAGAAAELAYRLRQARFGTSATWGGYKDKPVRVARKADQ
jgi:hypothetical protein